VRLQFPLWCGLCLLEGWHARQRRYRVQAISDSLIAIVSRSERLKSSSAVFGAAAQVAFNLLSFHLSLARFAVIGR
jgi:hypothetical protein